MVLVANPIFGAAAIFSHREALFHQLPRAPQLLGGEVGPAGRSRFPFPLEFVQRLATFLV